MSDEMGEVMIIFGAIIAVLFTVIGVMFTLLIIKFGLLIGIPLSLLGSLILTTAVCRLIFHDPFR